MHVRLNFLLALATSASANWLATELYSDGVHNAPPRNLNTCLEADRSCACVGDRDADVTPATFLATDWVSLWGGR